MQPQGIEAQVDRLDRRVEMLEQVPERLDRLDGHILQFTQETRDEFSAVRTEMRQQGEELRAEMREQGAELRAEMRQQGEVLRGEMRELGEELRGEMREQGTRLEGLFRSELQAQATHTHNGIATLGVMLSDRIEKGLAENAAQNRVLYEDLAGRIAALGESRS